MENLNAQEKTKHRILLGPMAISAVAALLFVSASDTAFAQRCTYSNGTSDNGPCVTVRNRNFRTDIESREMNLWCHNGPTSRTHKIILNPTNEFVCRGSGESTVVTVQRTQAGCNYCDYTLECSGHVKLTLGHWTAGEGFNEHGCDE